jgi:hypothetical protein
VEKTKLKQTENKPTDVVENKGWPKNEPKTNRRVWEGLAGNLFEPLKTPEVTTT